MSMLPYAAIDPLALMFSGKWYLILTEKLHPNEPPTAAIQATVRQLGAEEKQALVAHAKRVASYATAVVAAAEAR